MVLEKFRKYFLVAMNTGNREIAAMNMGKSAGRWLERFPKRVKEAVIGIGIIAIVLPVEFLVIMYMLPFGAIILGLICLLIVIFGVGQSHRRTAIAIGVAAGFVLLALSVHLFVNSYDFVNRGVRTGGIIMADSDKSDSDANQVISFRTAWGKTVRVPYGSSINSNPFVWPGSKITVIYDPEHPSNARIYTWYTWADLWVWPVTTLMLGSSALSLSFWGWRTESRKRKMSINHD